VGGLRGPGARVKSIRCFIVRSIGHAWRRVAALRKEGVDERSRMFSSAVVLPCCPAARAALSWDVRALQISWLVIVPSLQARVMHRDAGHASSLPPAAARG
jgi:hypothetical protein